MDGSLLEEVVFRVKAAGVEVGLPAAVGGGVAVALLVWSLEWRLFIQFLVVWLRNIEL